MQPYYATRIACPRHRAASAVVPLVWLALLFTARTARPQTAPTPVVLDRVVAVVNNRAILESDLRNEVRLSVFEPNRARAGRETPQQALQRLVSRTLIRQQIRAEDTLSTAPPDDDVAARLKDLRTQLPICVAAHCATSEGWASFLSAHALTEPQVQSYLRDRLEILHFIEQRFRQGIRISDDEVADYYNHTLLPQYQPGQTAPPLSQVAPRIQEILLQQQVNTLFSDWLDNLRKQGDVEILDPSLEDKAAEPTGAGSE